MSIHRGICQSRDLSKCLGLRGKGLSSPPPKKYISQALGLKHLRFSVVGGGDGDSGGFLFI